MGRERQRNSRVLRKRKLESKDKEIDRLEAATPRVFVLLVLLQFHLIKPSFFLATPMACHLITAPVGLLNAGIDLGAKRLFHWSITPHRRYSTKFRRIRAVQENEGPRRLVDIIRIIPEVSRNYFKSRSRRALFGGISLLGGFYVAQTISLSFGALGVNDVIAAVVCVLLTEYVTRFYYSRPKITFPLALLNNFKMGFTYGLFIDAFKLAS
ncbi:hypothetical protein J5N97_012491 [Dioscorea zingiberensis]|uniref:Ycf20-like protein n=1 Tax=Dioscorea zingiberensis TaxID=325984 RepID=A0A9D5CQE5_9LILI|nr:hypothetical protein J5N97_012491 [Dioscorea zingiberensis]